MEAAAETPAAVRAVVSDANAMANVVRALPAQAPIMRLVCRAWHGACTPYKAFLSSFLGWLAREGLEDLLRWVAGQCGAAQLCGAAYWTIQEAAGRGRLNCMALIHGWPRPEAAPNHVAAQLAETCMSAAARGGHLECLRAAHAWGVPADALHRVIVCAAAGGDVDCAAFTRGALSGAAPPVPSASLHLPWSTPHAAQHALQSALTAAAEHGHVPMAQLVRSWGTRPEDEHLALGAAARCGQIECVRLIRGWGVSGSGAEGADPDAAPWATQAWELANHNALYWAASSGRLDIMRLTRAWGAASLDKALEAAAQGGHIDCMRALHEWGAAGLDRALCAAAGGDHTDCMRLALEWGATAHGVDLALTVGDAETAALFLEWSSTVTREHCRVALLEAIREIDYPENVVRLLCEYSARTPAATLAPADLEEALRAAATVNEWESMEILREHGARDFDAALLDAADTYCDCDCSCDGPCACVHEDCGEMLVARRLLEWGAVPSAGVLVRAAAHGNAGALCVIHESRPTWDPATIQAALVGATRQGHWLCVRWLLSWDPRLADAALILAAGVHDSACMRVAHAWGATCFELAAVLGVTGAGALEDKAAECRALARDWAAQKAGAGAAAVAGEPEAP